jgi:hypothetical protein
MARKKRAGTGAHATRSFDEETGLWVTHKRRAKDDVGPCPGPGYVRLYARIPPCPPGPPPLIEFPQRSLPRSSSFPLAQTPVRRGL